MKLHKEIKRRETEIKGLRIFGFLQSRYTVKLRIRSGSRYVFDVTKFDGHKYVVRFQFVKWSIVGGANQYRGLTCTCPRFRNHGNCHHILLAYAAHAEKVNLEIFANFQLSIRNEQLFKAA